uniref:Uncharacterized protein n=1 Tax=Picea glauca TaxID=3330 RepID=A0A117NGW6_PICGL|nr:hypothetical protein ABT39_MTgene5621 [Picea glauca]QHR88070.1 hypothetical protein Q903MT_gene2083 [Picea sitchensis]
MRDCLPSLPTGLPDLRYLINLFLSFLLWFDCISLAFLQIEDHSPAMSLRTTCSTLSISAPLVQPAHDLTNCTTLGFETDSSSFSLDRLSNRPA